MNVVSLCSGVGLIDLGLEWAGLHTIQLCELDGWRRDRLAQRFPGVPIHDDVHTIDPPSCDVIAAGFPCPPTSRAGKQRAQLDERWIWPAVCDAIRRARPRYVIVENPPGILDGHGAFGDVLGSLATLGFDAQWTCFPASNLGAPHRRDRLFLVASNRTQFSTWEHRGGFFAPGWGEEALAWRTRANGTASPNNDNERTPPQAGLLSEIVGRTCDVPPGIAADTSEVGRNEGSSEEWGSWWWRLIGDYPHPFGSWGAWTRRRPALPFVPRMDDGRPERLDRSQRCEALGDAVVPQCAELIGLRLRQLDEATP